MGPAPVLLASASASAPPISDQRIAFLMVTALSSGMSIITCGFVMVTRGPSFKVMLDRERQRFLAMISLLAALFGVLGNGLQQSSHSGSAGTSVASFFFNWLVQIGFAGIAHNSIIRLMTSQASVPAREKLFRVSRFCCIFYLLTLPVLTPTFIALINPRRADVKVVARDLNIALLVAVELLATTADVLLLYRFTKHKENGHATRRRMIRDMWIVYAVIWLTIAIDIFAKVFRNYTNDLVPDLAVTNLTLTLRALAAIMYGTSVRNAQEIHASHSGSFGHSLSKDRTLPFHNPGEIALGEALPSQGSVAPDQKARGITITTTTEMHRDGNEGYYYSPKAFDDSN